MIFKFFLPDAYGGYSGGYNDGYNDGYSDGDDENGSDIDGEAPADPSGCAFSDEFDPLGRIQIF